MKSVCPHQQDEKCQASFLPLGCFYCFDRRRQVFGASSACVWPAGGQTNRKPCFYILWVRSCMAYVPTQLIYSARASLTFWLQMLFFLLRQRLSWEFQYLRFLMFLTWRWFLHLWYPVHKITCYHRSNFYDSGSYSVNCTQRLYTPWSGWMELAPQPPQEGLIATSEKAAKTR